MTDMNECDDDPTNCGDNSDCTNTAGSFYCVCQTGYRGDARVLCSDINECDEDPSSCHVNGECSNTNGSFSCQCSTGYSGDGNTSCTGEFCFLFCLYKFCNCCKIRITVTNKRFP